MDDPGRPPPPPTWAAQQPPPPPPGMPPPAPRPGPALDLAAAFRFGWEVFRASPGPLMGAVALAYGLLLVLGVGTALLATAFIGLQPPRVAPVLVLAAVAVPAFLVAAQLPAVWTLRAGTEAAEGRRPEFGRLVATKGLGTALGAAALVMVGVVAGYLLLLVPGIVFGVLAAFTLHHVIDEGREPFDAVRASIALFRRQPGPAIGLFFVPTFAAGLGTYLCGIGVVVSMPVAMIAQVHGFRQLTGRPVQPAPSSRTVPPA